MGLRLLHAKSKSHDGFRNSFHCERAHRLEVFRTDQISGRLRRPRFADGCESFEAAGEIHCRADHRVFDAFVRTEVAHRTVARGDTGAHCEHRRGTALCRRFIQSINQTYELSEHRDARPCIRFPPFAACVAEADQRTVAEELVQIAFVSRRQFDERREETVEQARQIFRFQPFGERGEVRDVDERNRQPPPLERRFRRSRRHRCRDIARQPVALQLEFARNRPQSLAHTVHSHRFFVAECTEGRRIGNHESKAQCIHQSVRLVHNSGHHERTRTPACHYEDTASRQTAPAELRDRARQQRTDRGDVRQRRQTERRNDERRE